MRGSPSWRPGWGVIRPNSSIPPSADSIAAKAKRQVDRSSQERSKDRKPGGQPGRKWPRDGWDQLGYHPTDRADDHPTPGPLTDHWHGGTYSTNPSPDHYRA